MKSRAVSIYRALGNTTRLEIVQYLLLKGESSCQHISERFPLSQPTLSHHFSKLTQAGIISVRRDGQMHFYEVNKTALKGAGLDQRLLKELTVAQ